MKIIYMNSFSRSGETLLARSLNAHKNIRTLHQLYNLSEESEELYDVFKRIKINKPRTIEISNNERIAIGIKDEEFLLVKNAIFEIKDSHYGFILVRNPFSVFASYKKMVNRIEPRSQMRRWAGNIDKNLLPIVENERLIDAFCALYLRKMDQVLNHNLPIIHYEKFVKDPKAELKKLLKELNLSWDNNVLLSHEHYPEGKKGHGGIRLDKPIFSNNYDELPKLSEEEKSVIYGYTSSLLIKLSYKVKMKQNRIYVEK